MSDNPTLSDISRWRRRTGRGRSSEHPEPAETTPMDDVNLPEPLAAGELAHLEELARKARAYARGAKAENTRRAYAADWHHYTAWCARRGVQPMPPAPQAIGL